MSLAAIRQRLQVSVFGTPDQPRLADAALWEGVAATVRVEAPEKVVGFGDTEIIQPAAMLIVPRAQVAAPQIGDEVSITATGATYRILADPVLNQRSEWVCEAEAI